MELSPRALPYAARCGHCRKFEPQYKQLAKSGTEKTDSQTRQVMWENLVSNLLEDAQIWYLKRLKHVAVVSYRGIANKPSKLDLFSGMIRIDFDRDDSH